MESRKIFVVLFIVVTAGFFKVCRAQDDNKLTNIHYEKQCACEWNAGTTTVPDILFQHITQSDVHNSYYMRQIIFLYYDLLENVIKIHIPNKNKQKIIPNAPIENDDVFITLTNETVHDLFRNNPQHVTLEYYIKLDKPKIQNNFNSDPKTLVEHFQPINPTDLKLKVPINIRKELWTESKKHPNSKYIQTHVSPNYFREDFWPGSYVSVPHTYTIHQSDIKPEYFGKQDPGQSVQVQYPIKMPLNKPMTNLYKPGDPVMMLRPDYSQIQPCLECERAKYYKVNITPYMYLNPKYQSLIKQINSAGQKYYVPIDFSSVVWSAPAPSLSVEIPHPTTLHQNDIKPVVSREQDPNHTEEVHSQPHRHDDIKPSDSGETKPSHPEVEPHSNLIIPSGIKPIDSVEKQPKSSGEEVNSNLFHPSDKNPIVSGEEASYSEGVPHLKPFRPDEIKPIDFEGESIDSVQEEDKYSKEALDSNLLHPDDIKPINSGKPEPEYSNKEVYNSHSLSPSKVNPVSFDEQEPSHSKEAPLLRPLNPSDIKPIDSAEKKPNYSDEEVNPNLLQPGDNIPINSGEPELEYSEEEVHNSHSLRPSTIKPVGFDEQEPGHSEEIPHVRPLNPSDMKPTDYVEAEPKYSEEEEDSNLGNPGDINSIISGEQASYSEDVHYSQPLRPDDIKPIDLGQKELDHSEEVPHSHPLNSSDIKPIDSVEKEPKYSKEVLNSNFLHPDDINPINSGEPEPEYSEEMVPNSDSFPPSTIKPEPQPDHSEEVLQSQSLRHDDIKPSDSGEEDPGHPKEEPHLNSFIPSVFKPVDSGDEEPDRSEEVSQLQPFNLSDNKPIDSVVKEPKYSEEALDSNLLHPGGITSINSGEPEAEYSEEEVHNSHSIRTNTMKPVGSDKQEPGNSEEVPYLRPLNLSDIKPYQNKIPLSGYKQRKEPLAYMGYKTFDEWFREEMHRFKNNNKTVNVNSVGHLILEILNENGMVVTEGGVLKDHRGRVLSLRNLKLRPILIGDSMSFDNLFEKDGNKPAEQYYTNPAVSTWSEFVVLTTLYPPKTLGVIPMGTTSLPSSSPVHSSLFQSQDGSKLWSVITKKKHNKRQSPNYLLPDHNKQYRYLNPVKINEPEIPFGSKNKLNQDIKTQVPKDDAVKDSKSYDESVESFLRNMPHYSYSRKGYINRNDLSGNDQLNLDNVESSNSNTPLKKTKQKNRTGPIQNKHDNNDKNLGLIRIIGDIAAMGLNNNVRPGDQHKANNKNSHNHGSNNHKKQYHDYINREDFYRDDSLVRIIGGNAATGSGYPLNNKGRSGEPH